MTNEKQYGPTAVHGRKNDYSLSKYHLDDFLRNIATEEQLARIIQFTSEMANTIRKGFLQTTTGGNIYNDTYNIFEEKQAALDVYANEVLVRGFKKKDLPDI
jgi:fructose-1,6-bisphosphatase